MSPEDVHKYVAGLLSRLPLGEYVERRFTALDATAASVDTDMRFRGVLREREPKLQDVISHPQSVILAEPGGGKSVVARAAVHLFVDELDRIPVFSELKEYRGSLSNLLAASAPHPVLDPYATIAGEIMKRAYILDGLDEIPRDTLSKLGIDLRELLESDPTASVLLTARQAFYAAHRDELPSISSLFHILDFSDDDIDKYLAKSNISVDSFLAAVRTADAIEEIRNPFILSVMIDKYRHEGVLSNRRSENLSYMIDSLISSRPRVNRHKQHRALKMLGVALETYSRNELTEDEALTIIRESMRISDAEAQSLLDELYGSILKRTGNGLAFQMRSYGEYLAAEELEDCSVGRFKELAYTDSISPNETWINAVSYLVELNPEIRRHFVAQYPLWTISASVAAFLEEEKTAIVASILRLCVREKQFIVHHPLISPRKLSLFVNETTKEHLIQSLSDPDNIVRGNAMVLLGMTTAPEVLELALEVVKDLTLDTGLRYCAIVALVNLRPSNHLPELLESLDSKDPLHVNFLDMLGAIIDESQISIILPLVFRENAMLSAAYYHFREFKTREALVQMLNYLSPIPTI